MKKLLLLFLFFPVLNCFSQNWEKNYDYVDNCICGLSKVKKDNKVGYVNKEGVEIVKLQYDEGLTFNEGYAAVRKGSKWLFIDSMGKTITAAIFDDALSFSEGLAAVAKDDLYGFINPAGDLVIPYSYSNAHGFTEGLAPASNSKGFWGFIDTKGGWVVNPMYDYTDNFANGEARVIKNNKVFYIDKKNKVLHD